MTSTILTPFPVLRFVDNNGNSLSGGKLFTYVAGTTTKQNTYTDSTGNTANTNPVVLNSRGEAPVWLTPGLGYKMTLSPSSDTDPPTNAIWTVDQIMAPVTPSALIAMSAAVNETSATLASASTVAIGAAEANYIFISGTTTITAFDTVQSGTERTLEFQGALTLTYNATSLILPGAANITTAAGDTAIFRSEGSGNWRCIVYQPARNMPNASPAGGEVILSTTGSTNVTLSPRNGCNIIIDGVQYQIPSGGISATTTSCFVNGTAAQALAVSTLYYIYLFNNSGTLTLDFSTTGHATDTTAGNVGIEIKSGDSTRSLVGMVYTDGSANINNTVVLRNLANWFVRSNNGLFGSFTSTGITSESATEIATGARVEAVTWANESTSLTVSGSVASASSNPIAQTSVGTDGSASGSYGFSTGLTTANVGLPTGAFMTEQLSEGHHVFSPFGLSAGGQSITFSVGIQGIVRN